MQPSLSLQVTLVTGPEVADDELQHLLHSVYVTEGFTDPDVAKSVFAAAAVRARGDLFIARHNDALVGTVIVVPPGAPASRVAKPSEAELHLMAVRTDHRRHGIGKMLMQAAVDFAKQRGIAGIALSTQSSMQAAHRLYESFGFSRDPERDWNFRGRSFLVFHREL